MMIPKVIHYCWFGRNPKNDIVKMCIDSWKKHCPDYEIIEWNEDNFDVNQIPYSKDAYADKKWAFVSDYARINIIYNHGGIYLDTDVLLKKSLDELLSYECWMACDDVRYVATGLGFGAVKGNKYMAALNEAYATYSYPAGTNVVLDTKVLEQKLPSWVKSYKSQVINDLLILGTDDYLSFASHLYTWSYLDDEVRSKRHEQIKQYFDRGKGSLKTRAKWKLQRFVRNPKLINYIDAKHRNSFFQKAYTFMAYDLIDNGIWYYIKRLFKKLFSN